MPFSIQTTRREQCLDLAQQCQARGDEADVFHAQRRFVGRQQQRHLLFERHLERIPSDRRHPGALHRCDRRQLDVTPVHGTGGTRRGERLQGRALRTGARHRAGRREPPAAVDEHAHAHAVGFGVADAADLPLADADRLAAIAADANVGVRRTRASGRIERDRRNVDRRRIGWRSRQRLRQRTACDVAAGGERQRRCRARLDEIAT
jgi:hypothetical protein